jgi:hypothetical protein
MSRPLQGESPTVDLVLVYKKSNQSPILKLPLSRLGELVARVPEENRQNSYSDDTVVICFRTRNRNSLLGVHEEGGAAHPFKHLSLSA